MIRRGVNYLIYLKNFIGSITCETAGRLFGMNFVLVFGCTLQ